MRYVVYGNTGVASRARIIEACIKTKSKLLSIWAPYELQKGCRIEYLIEISEENLENFKSISKCGYIERQGEMHVN